MHPVDIILIGLIASAVVFALLHLCKKRKSGCSCCCADCRQSCPMAQKEQENASFEQTKS